MESLLIAASLSLSSCRRVAVGDTSSGTLYVNDSEVASLKGDPAPWEDKDLNFKFMTSDFTYTGHETGGMMGTMWEWFGGRATVDNVRPEIVNGHTCQKRGQRDDTYYASSLCYWIPDNAADQYMQRTDKVLVWKGGQKYSSSSKDFCKGFMELVQAGQCVKCATCHNNARGDEGAVQSTSFVVQIPLPENCLKESEIERRIIADFDRNSGDLKSEDTRCQTVERRYDTAVNALDRCVKELERLPRVIQSELPQEIEQAKTDISWKQGVLQSAQQSEQTARGRMARKCQQYMDIRHTGSWQNMLLGGSPTESLLNAMTFHCHFPIMPRDNKDGRYWDELARYQIQKRTHRACQKCERSKGEVQKGVSENCFRAECRAACSAAGPATGTGASVCHR